MKPSILLRFLALAGLFWLGVARAEIVDRVAAVVNKDIITLSEIYDLGGEYIESEVAAAGELLDDGPARRAAELEVLESLIQRKLVVQELQRMGMDVTPDELERAIDDVARQNRLTREQLRVEVERSGLPWTLYRQELEESVRQMKFAQAVLQPRVQVSEDEVRDLYNRRVRSSDTGQIRQLQGIFLPWDASTSVDDKAALAKRAAEIKAQADSGVPWDQLVADNPDSKLYGARGGLGSFRKGEAVAEIDGPAFGVPIGGVTDPIALPNGVLVVRVASAEQGPAPDFELVRADLEQELLQTKMEQEMEIWYTQARRQATVRVKIEPPTP